MGMKQRACERRTRMVANRAATHEEAETWDLEYWQSKSPQERLSALAAILRDVEKVRKRKRG